MSNNYISNDEADALDNALPALQNIQAGQKLRAALAGTVTVGKRWYLDAVNGADGNDGLSYETAFKTLPVAYAALTANKNEILLKLLLYQYA